MPLKRISAVIAGSLIAFFWGFLSWELLTWHEMKSFENEEQLSEVILQHAPEHGLYMLPGKNEEGKMSMEKISEGPFIYAVVRPGVRENFSMPRAILGSYATSLMGAIALGAMMQLGAKGFMARVMMGIFAGFFIGALTVMPQLNWFELPIRHVQATFFDGLISWSLAGLAMAFILSTRSKKAQTED